MLHYKNLDLKDIVYKNDEGIECVEQWKDIPDYEGLYQVSDLGRVKSLKKKIFGGKGFYYTKNKILKQHISTCGYLSFSIYFNSIAKKIIAHQLVAMAFLNHKPCGYKLVVDHINNIKTDNSVENLQIITQKENSRKDKNPISGYNYVYFENNRYRARFYFEGRKIDLGVFKSAEKANEMNEKAHKMLSNKEDISKLLKNKIPIHGKNITFHQGKYRVRITLNKKRINLPSFKTFEEAEIYIRNYKKENNIN